MSANNEFSPIIIFFKQCTITFTLISVDRVILLLKAHLLGVNRGVLYSRNVASFIFVDVINLLEITTGFTILLLTVRFNVLLFLKN